MVVVVVVVVVVGTVVVVVVGAVVVVVVVVVVVGAAVVLVAVLRCFFLTCERVCDLRCVAAAWFGPLPHALHPNASAPARMNPPATLLRMGRK